MKADSIIFDLDGTLWDSSKEVTDSWNKTFKECGVNKTLTVEDLMGVMGLLMEDIIKKFLPDLDEETRRKLLERCCEEENAYIAKVGGRLFDGLEETLQQLAKDFPLCIVSNCQAGYIEAFLEAHNLHSYFVDFENPGRTGKPKAENIRLVVERNHFKSPVYVGDTLGDATSAKKAGVPFIYARYGFGHVKEYAKAIDSIKELPGIVERLD